MAGHIRRRHRPDCAHRTDRSRRCNCDGPWQARYPDPQYPGTTRKIEKTFRVKRDADDWLAMQRTGVLVGTHVSPRQSERRFTEVLDAWKESWQGRLSPTTARRYESIVEKYLRPEL